jgi:hypothetical protein
VRHFVRSVNFFVTVMAAKKVAKQKPAQERREAGSGPELVDDRKRSRAERFKSSQERILKDHAETFRKLSQ